MTAPAPMPAALRADTARSRLSPWPAPRRDKRVHRHLVDVYRTLAIGVGCASVGVYADYTGLTARYLPLFNGAGFATMLASFALLIWLNSVPVSNAGKREGIFYAFAGLQGLSIGTLVSLFLYVDPGVVLTAVVGTALIFACFTASALIVQDRRYIMLFGTLRSSRAAPCRAGGCER